LGECQETTLGESADHLQDFMRWAFDGDESPGESGENSPHSMELVWSAVTRHRF
jgi:hypothetical protein